MLHPDTALKFISPEVGHGIIATKLIPKGTIIWAFDKLDREYSESEILKLEPVYQEILETYTFRNNKGNFVFCWDNGRFMNHSFNSNCFSTAYNFEIAIRDIQAGEELTDDYGYLNIIAPFRASDEGTKRKIVYPDDLLRYHKIWDKKVAKVFGHIAKINQALRPVISDETWNEVIAVADGKKEMKSLLNNYYNQK